MEETSQTPTKTILHVVDSLNTICLKTRNIDRIRKELVSNMKFQHPTIKTKLISKADKNTGPIILKSVTLALEAIYNLYSKDWIQVYADRSAFRPL